jgi:hypothetical protein
MSYTHTGNCQTSETGEGEEGGDCADSLGRRGETSPAMSCIPCNGDRLAHRSQDAHNKGESDELRELGVAQAAAQ